MNPMALLESLRPQIEAFCRRYGVERLRLFGSVLRPDWSPQSSDFDFLVEFGSPPPGINLFDQQFGLQVDLERVLGRPVDLVDWKAAKKPIFREIAEGQAKEFYAA
jgi:predicted nucleotidyltransferase